MIKIFLMGLSLLTLLSISSITSHASSISTSTSTDNKHAKEVWTCSMHPHVKQDHPGQCPICGMNLVKNLVKINNEKQIKTVTNKQSMGLSLPEGHAVFQLSQTRQQMIGVKYGEVKKKILFKSIEATGRVAFDPELYTAQNEYLEALQQRHRVQSSPLADVQHSAQRMVESAKLRLKILGLSDEQISGLKTSELSGSNLLIPKLGENIWVYAEVYDMDLPNVQPGLKAKISGGSLGSTVLMGEVASIDRVLNPTTRTAKARIQIPNAKAMLRPEAYVEAVILSPLGEQVTIPFDAILDTGKQAWVFVVKEGTDGSGQFEPRLITIKFRAEDEVAIASGLTAGEKIVTSANFLIDSESRLQGVQESQSEIPSPPKIEFSPKAKDKSQTQMQKILKSPECPKGQIWHASMNHCMSEVGR
jgi:Cu(I)/Ag(I) efflux system membrane fusion protein